MAMGKLGAALGLALLMAACSGKDRDDRLAIPLPAQLARTSIVCRACDRHGPDISVDFPISGSDEAGLLLCWVRDDRCWYGCETTGEVGGRGCNR